MKSDIDIKLENLVAGTKFINYVINGGKVSRKEFLCYEEEDQVFYLNTVTYHQTHRPALLCCGGVCYDSRNVNKKVENLIVFADDLHNRLNIFSSIM